MTVICVGLIITLKLNIFKGKNGVVIDKVGRIEYIVEVDGKKVTLTCYEMKKQK